MREDGFTLVEVLVSLAIFSLAVLGLNRAATLAVSGTSSLQLRTHAGFVADNAVVLNRIAPLNLETDRTEVQSGGIDFEVVVETRETEQAGFYEITVRVTQTDRERVLSDRRAFRYEQAPVVTVAPPAEGDE